MKYRNELALDIALEVFKLYCRQRPLRVGEPIRYARICRVEKVMRPYLEALL